MAMADQFYSRIILLNQIQERVKDSHRGRHAEEDKEEHKVISCF